MKNLLKPTFTKVLISVGIGIVIFFILASSCSQGFPDGEPGFPCNTDISRNILLSFLGFFFIVYPILYLAPGLSTKKKLRMRTGFNKNALGDFLMIGVVSGLLSFYSLYINSSLIFFFPGLVFGFSVGTYAFSVKKISLKRLFFFTVISTIGYSAAYVTALCLRFFAIGNIAAFVAIPVICGGIGSFVLITGFHHTINFLSDKQSRKLLIFGSILSLCTYIVPDGTLFASNSILAQFPTNWLFSLFLFWQTGMAVALGLTLFIKKNNKVLVSIHS